jgi:general secretion pathway protein J
MASNRRFNRGFTLVEVMMALGLLLVIGTAVARSMALSFETKDIVTQVNDRYHEGRVILSRMARELRMAFLRAEVPRENREEEPAVITRFIGEENEIYFASTSHTRIYAGTRESDQCEIAYFLGSSRDRNDYRGKTLYRRESRWIDNKPDKGGYVWPVVDGVKTLKIEYWDDEKEIGDDAWQRTWDSHENELEPLLPSRVRITLELEAPEGRQTFRFVTQAAPRIRRPINVIESQVKGAKK